MPTFRGLPHRDNIPRLACQEVQAAMQLAVQQAVQQQEEWIDRLGGGTLSFLAAEPYPFSLSPSMLADRPLLGLVVATRLPHRNLTRSYPAANPGVDVLDVATGCCSKHGRSASMSRSVPRSPAEKLECVSLPCVQERVAL